MFCTKCGNELKQGAKFCPSCGNAVSAKAASNKTKQNKPKQTSRYQQPSKGVTIPMPALIIGAVLVVFLGFLIMRKPANSTANYTPVPTNNVSPALQAQLAQVAEGFTCFCGQCNDKLMECDCTNSPNGAMEVKQFILTGLEQGKTVDQMKQAVTLKYQPS